jgi:DNA polymerase-3 subunit delta
MAGEAVRAVRMLAGLRAEGDQVAGLMPMVAKEVLTLCALSRAAESGNVMSAMRAAHIWESKQAIYRRALERHPLSRWEAFAAECGRIDRASKGRFYGDDAWLMIERLLVGIADARARKLLA